jgi:hypothetical protein
VRANSDHSRDAAHNSVAFCETTPFRVQSPIATTHLPGYRQHVSTSARQHVSTSARRATRHLLIRAHGGAIAGGGHVTSPGSLGPGSMDGLPHLSCFGSALSRLGTHGQPAAVVSTRVLSV